MDTDETRQNSIEETAPDAETVTEAEETAAEEAKSEKPKKKEVQDAKRKLAEATEKLTQLDNELAETKDKYQRLLAEYDNYRKRSTKEREGVYTDAVADVIAAILPIADNLERAALFGAGDEMKVAEGLAMTAKSLEEMLSRFGVSVYGAAGETFDPALHNAVMHEDDEAKGEGEITEVYQRGYRKGDKIVRYAMVKVAN